MKPTIKKLKTYSAEELKEILEKHRRWLHNQDGTQERADLSGTNLSEANLSGADLRGADLSDTDLSGADLSGTDLSGTDLSDTDLSGTDLSDTDLSDTNLRGVDLRGVDLRGADLSGLKGNLRHIKSLQIETYCITYTSKIIQIGCQRHTIEEWKNLDDETIRKMGSKALEWWKKWKPILMQIIEMSPCEETK